MENNLSLINNEKNIFNKIKFDELLFVLGVFCFVLSQIVLYLSAPYVKILGSNTYEQLGFTSKKNILILYIGYVFLLLCSFFNMRDFAINCKKKYLIGISLFVICIYSLIQYIDVFFRSGFIISIYDTTTPIIYCVTLVLCIASNKRIFNIFLKLNCYITFIAILLAIYFFLDFRKISSNGVLGNSGYMKFYIQAFFSALLTCYTLKSKIIGNCVIFLLILLAFLNAARSFIVQGLIFLIIFNCLTARKKGIAFLLSIFFLCVVVVVSFSIMKNYFSSSYEHFINKLFTDTRSDQYVQLFGQIKFKDLILGNGYYFTYLWNGEDYSYIDNVYIFLLVRYGFIFIVPLLVIFIYSLFSGFQKNNRENMYLSLILFQWLLAYAGLAVYVTIELDYKIIVLFMIIGKLLLKGEKNCENKSSICV